ncbi:hypothetical protein ACJIZ3_022819 [Penstemon smallii]|uniref:Uncharacterized protein n=1 Tax=Penstemon smallii TaxID=265156 RepID=A0ABD3TPM7_9LAMI
MAEVQQKNPMIAFFTNLISSIKLEDETALVYKNPAVTFPKRTEDFASLKLEPETEDAERSTNPLLLWQVYAIGGAFILRWAWTRWNERKGQKKPDDGPPPSEKIINLYSSRNEGPINLHQETDNLCNQQQDHCLSNVQAEGIRVRISTVVELVEKIAVCCMDFYPIKTCLTKDSRFLGLSFDVVVRILRHQNHRYHVRFELAYQCKKLVDCH